MDRARSKGPNSQESAFLKRQRWIFKTVDTVSDRGSGRRRQPFTLLSSRQPSSFVHLKGSRPQRHPEKKRVESKKIQGFVCDRRELRDSITQSIKMFSQ
ncbi:uncharacterized protein DFL_002769 [Arthrobotrys flagrans]|uniref:Uncharacterized protein n=1 Tax=Arthrobotrys flagrans TaxID=97331 RepID=A0A437ACP9_ARTFL|nr:hypothetical protein DFL_002769 [Arthrobotrys flagrans]